MHIGVDDTLGLIHSIDTTAANVHDIVFTGNLLHGDEQRVFGDAGYLGVQKRDEHKNRKNVSWFGHFNWPLTLIRWDVQFSKRDGSGHAGDNMTEQADIDAAELARAAEGLEGLHKVGLRYPISPFSTVTDPSEGLPANYGKTGE
jgi:hypothetical protein